MVFPVQTNVLFDLIKRRCVNHGCKLISDDNYESFIIIQTVSHKRICFNKELNENAAGIKISVDHLYGLYDPNLFFTVFEILANIRHSHNLSLNIVSDNLVLFNENAKQSKKATNKLFQFLTQECDNLKNSDSAVLFNIQLSVDECFVINYCLKISNDVMEKVLSNNALRLVINLANTYLQCFCKAPVCIRMHSISEDTIVHDFQPFSYQYIMNNKECLIHIAKLLYPFVENIDNVYLEKYYMEIMPTYLIKVYHYRLALLLSEVKCQLTLYQHLESIKEGNVGKYFDDVERVVLEKQNVTLEQYPLESDVVNIRDNVKDAFAQIGEEEGILLSLEQKLIEIFFRRGCEVDVEYNKQLLLTCLERIYDLRDNLYMKGIKFRVRSDGCFVFNNYCNIWPSTIIKIKNQLLLIKKMGELSDTMTGIKSIDQEIQHLKESKIDDDKIDLFCLRKNKLVKTKKQFLSVIEDDNEDEYRNDFTRKKIWELFKSSEDFLINAAKLFNPILSNIPSHLFKMKGFCCIPPSVFLLKRSCHSLLIDSLTQIRNINMTLSPDPLEFNNFISNYFKCDLSLIHNLGKEPKSLKAFLEIMEDISADIGKRVEIDKRNYLKIVDEEDTGLVQNDGKQLEECLGIVKNFGKSVCIDSDVNNNSWISFGWYFQIRCDVFLKIKPQNYEKLFKAVKYYKSFQNAGGIFQSDHWINYNQIENESLKAKFIEIAKIEEPLIEKFENSDIISCIDILPENILPPRLYVNSANENNTTDKEWKEQTLERLISNLKTVIGKLKCGVFFKSEGQISIVFSRKSCQYYPIELSPSKWLQIKSIEAFKKMYDIMKELCCGEGYRLYPSGCVDTFDSDTNVRRVYSSESEEAYQILTRNLFKTLTNYGKNMSLTVDGDGNILIGHFIWIRPTVDKKLVNDISEVAIHCEDAIIQRNDNSHLMSSVNGLENQTNAIALATRANIMLEKIPDADLCKTNIKIFPSVLYEQWLKNSDDVFQKMTHVFDEMQKRSITWNINFNGHFLISDYITLTAKHLLKLKDFDKLESLIKRLREPINNYLTCEEEILNARNQEKKTYRTKIDAGEVFTAREEQKLGVRVDPNLALTIENLLVIHPDDFLGNTGRSIKDIFEIINTIKAAFTSTEDMMFEFGHLDFPVWTSLFHRASEKGTQYANNLRDFLKQQVNVNIDEETNMFLINDSLRIHPKAFFHLQNAKKVMSALQKLNSKSLLLLEDESLMRSLKTNIKDKSLEEHYLLKIGKTLWNNKDRIKKEGVKGQLNALENEQYGVNDLVINNHLIFKEPMIYRMLNENGEVKVAEELLVLALNVAADLSYKSKDMIDFTCLVQIVGDYCQGDKESEDTLKETRIEIKPLTLLTSSEQYVKMMEFLESQIKKIEIYNTQYEQQFSIVQLENWMKEGSKYDNLIDCLEAKRKKMEEAFVTALKQVVSQERLEFEQPRKTCLAMIGKIFWKNIDKISFPNVEHIHLSSNKDEMYGIENVKVKSVKIFKEGLVYSLLNEKNVLKFKDSLFILALKFSATLDENLKCRNTFDFNTILEIINEYCQGAEVDDNGKLNKGKNLRNTQLLIAEEKNSQNLCRRRSKSMINFVNRRERSSSLPLQHQTEYEKMTQFFKEEMKKVNALQNKYNYKFNSDLKGLHHWIKHGYDFDNVEHYYNEMNIFFKSTKKYIAEFNTQNGYLILRNYKNDKYFGSLMISDVSNKIPRVATFFFKHTTTALLFTDSIVTFEHKIKKYIIKSTTKNPNLEFLKNRKWPAIRPKTLEEGKAVKGILTLLKSINDYDKNAAEEFFKELRTDCPEADIAICINSAGVDEKWLCLSTFIKSHNDSETQFCPKFIDEKNEDDAGYIRFTAETGSKIKSDISLVEIEEKTFKSFKEKISNKGDGEFDFANVRDILIRFDDTLMAEQNNSSDALTFPGKWEHRIFRYRNPSPVFWIVLCVTVSGTY